MSKFPLPEDRQTNKIHDEEEDYELVTVLLQVFPFVQLQK